MQMFVCKDTVFSITINSNQLPVGVVNTPWSHSMTKGVWSRWVEVGGKNVNKYISVLF